MIAWAVVDPGQAWHVQSSLDLESTACHSLESLHMCNLCVLVQHLVIIMEPEDNAARQSYSRGDFANKLTLLDYYVMCLVSCHSSLPLTCKICWDRNMETAYCHQLIPTTWGALRSHAMGAGRCYPMCLTKSISFALSAATCAFHKMDVWKCSLLRITARLSPDS